MTFATIGLAQTLVHPGDVDGNLRRAAEMVAEAASKGCDIVVLPECVDVGWTDVRAVEFAQPIPGVTSDFFCELARTHSIMIATGLTEREGDRIYNAAILVDRTGTIVAHHRKINELEFARKIYDIGTELKVVDTEFGPVALNICADNYVSSLALADAQAAMGARLMLSPSSWAVPADHDDEATPYVEWQEPYQAIGKRHGIPVIGVSNVGPVETGEWAGWVCIGRSLATDASGEIVGWGSYGVDASELTVVRIDVPA
ncbi:MAG TPA: carbon-nitrogen hydrolase family protein [Terrimesophilobacter sp.]|nr:carbon-nitrogen hydrolase family protein [Terrimesophilobacter sp.]HRP99111.1 carbon-nitrogen hydrolase family protein [Terrimesophilobacter sp.]